MTQPAPEAAHGMDTILKVNGVDISHATKTSTLELNPDIHDISGYGVSAKRKRGGLTDGTFSASGWYDTVEMAKPTWLRTRSGERVPVVRQLLGEGATLPQDSFQAIIGKYSETAPVDDIVTWACDFAIDGPVDFTPQAA